MLKRGLGVTAIVLWFVSAAAVAEIPQEVSQFFNRFVPLEEVQIDDPARFSLGQQLFQEKGLSGKGDLSCASCHRLDRYFSTANTFDIGASGSPLARNATTVLNVSLNYVLGWKGHIPSLKSQADSAITRNAVMAGRWEQIVPYLQSLPEYRAAFENVYDSPVSREHVLDAIVYFENHLVAPSRFDRFLKGEDDALTAEEQQGFVLFNRLGCSACHNGINLGGNMIQQFGVFSHKASDVVAGMEFRVAPLRNVAMTAPYFHDGRRDTLGGAIRLMAQYQLGRDLADQQVKAIELFLHTLSAEPDSWLP